jgi:hypothetical protein
MDGTFAVGPPGKLDRTETAHDSGPPHLLFQLPLSDKQVCG